MYYSKKLEETYKAIKTLANELNARKTQKEEWQWICLPASIADQVRSNSVVAARVLLMIKF